MSLGTGLSNGEGLPPPVVTGPRRAMCRDDVEAWIDDVWWWESKPRRTPDEPR